MQKVKQNSERTIATISIILSLLFIFAIPTWVLLDESGGMDFGFAFAMFSLFLLLFSSVSAIIFWARANKLDDMRNHKDLLVHYTYSKEEWDTYLKFEHKHETDEKELLLIPLVGFSIFFSLLFLVIDFESGLFVTGVLLAINALIFSLVFVIQPKLRTHDKTIQNKEVFISKDGASIGNSLHMWGVFLTRFDGAKLIEKKSNHFLELTYSYLNPRFGRQYTTFHILVPKNKLSAANSAIKSLNSKN